MDASQITKLLQKQNTRYINRCQTIDSSTLTWKNQIQSSKYIKGVKTCDGDQNCNVPTNPACSVGNGVCSFGGSGRTSAIQTGSPQQFLNVLSGASGSASQVYSSESIFLQAAGRNACGVAGTNPAPSNSYVVLPGGNPETSNAQLQVPSCSYLCSNTNGPTNGQEISVNNNLNPYLPPFDTYYKFKNPAAQCGYPVQDQNQKHFVKQCHTRFPNANNGVNAVFDTCTNTTYLNPITKQFETNPYFAQPYPDGTVNPIPPTCDGCVLEPPYNSGRTIGWPAFIVGENISSESYSYSVSEDGQRVFITGFFSGSVNLYDGGITTTTSQPPIIQLVTLTILYDGFVACYSNDGKLLWATTIETRTGSVTQGFAVTDDSSGIYVTGLYDGNIEFYNGISQGLLNPLVGTGVAQLSMDSTQTTNGQFIVKYNTGGVVQWVNQVDNSTSIQNPPTNPDQKGIAFSITSNGSVIYISGIFRNLTKLYDAGLPTKGTQRITINNPNPDTNCALLAQYDASTGIFNWATLLSGNFQFGMGVSCDSSNVYMVSYTPTNVDYYTTENPPNNLGTVEITSQGYAFGSILISYDQSGNFNWINKLASIGGELLTLLTNALTIDSTGVYLGGWAVGPIDYFNGVTSGSPNLVLNTITCNGSILMKYNLTTGAVIWTQKQDSVGFYVVGTSLSADNNNGLYVMTSTLSDVSPGIVNMYVSPGDVSNFPSSTISVDPTAYSPNLQGILIKYDANGNLLWYTGIGSNANQFATFNVQASPSEIFVSGGGNDIVNFYNTAGLVPPSIIGATMDPTPSVQPFVFTTEYSPGGVLVLKPPTGSCPSSITNFIPSSVPPGPYPGGFTDALAYTWTPITNGNISLVAQFASSESDKTYQTVLVSNGEGIIYSNNYNYSAALFVNKAGCPTQSALTAPCFLAGAMVTLADGSEVPIETVKVGDKVVGAFGEINEVLALHQPLLGTNTMTSINEQHHTSSHHPHISIDKKFYAVKPSVAMQGTYGRSHPVIDGDGKVVDRYLSGLSPERLLTLEKGILLQTTSGPREVISLRTYSMSPYTQLYNLVVSGSHTYCVDGYAVTGWPSEEDFDYNNWTNI